jgi:hypothetical protein
MLRWLAALGFDQYLYAPKDDALLRRAWRNTWPAEQRSKLIELAQTGAEAGLTVAVGLSPYALYRTYDRPARLALQSRVREIADCGVDALALLFDDMPGEVDALAERQAEIAADLRHWEPALELRLCPSYYSDDPVLDRVFGARPDGYLEDLGRLVPREIPVFWTGPQVCAAELRSDDLHEVARRCRRALAIWDNYPVNDSRARSEHLYLAPLENRDRLAGELAESHWCNAMNQPALSLPALASLIHLYGREREEEASVLAEAGISESLRRACLPLAARGRETLRGEALESLLRVAAASTPAGAELADWLAGEYRFDPACLTD